MILAVKRLKTIGWIALIFIVVIWMIGGPMAWVVIIAIPIMLLAGLQPPRAHRELTVGLQVREPARHR